MLKKLKSAAGFTLSETLIAVVILVLITSSALPAALRAYQNAVDAANAQVLLSTAVNALRDELSTAWNVDVNGTTITYYSADTGDKSVISIMSVDKDGKPVANDAQGEPAIMLQEYCRENTPGWWGSAANKPTASPRPLVSDAMRQTTRKSGEYMTVTYTEASCDGQYVTITGLTVKRGDSVLAEMPAETGLLIRVMSAEAAAGSDNTNDEPSGG